MFESVLLGFDGTRRSADALALALLLAGREGRVTAAWVHPPHANRNAPGFAELDTAGVGLRFLDDPVPPRALHGFAERIGADLIVVGSTARGAFGRAFPGTTADRVMHGAPCPVAVAPHGYLNYAPSSLRRVGAGVCDAPEAHAALEAAVAIAEASGATLEAVSAFQGAAVERVRYGDLGTGELLVNARESARADVEDAIALLAPGLPVTVVHEDGEPAAVLIEQAAKLDLVVIGSRGFGPIGRVLLGSVSHTLVLRCPSPLLVIPRGAGGVVGVLAHSRSHARA
jgi:nucleotide-binding universal stress UspA family protein